MNTIEEKSEIQKLPRRHSSRKKSNIKKKLQCEENIGFQIEPITDLPNSLKDKEILTRPDLLKSDEETVVDRTFMTDLDETHQKIINISKKQKGIISDNSDVDGSILQSLENTIEYQKSVKKFSLQINRLTEIYLEYLNKVSDFEAEANCIYSNTDESEDEIINMSNSVQLCQPVSLTWNHLNVKIVKKKSCCKKPTVSDEKFILKNGKFTACIILDRNFFIIPCNFEASGYAKPGEVLAIMGASGKKNFLTKFDQTTEYLQPFIKI